MNFKRCGNILSNNASFCSQCGEQLTQKDNKISKKNNIKIIIIVTIGILLVIGGLYIFKSLNNNDINSNETNNNEIDKNETFNDDQNNQLYEDDNLKEENTFELFDPSKIEKIAAEDNELTKNIEIKEIFFNPNHTSYGITRDAYIYGKNNNSTAITVELTLEYYDSEGYRIKRNTESEVVAAGKEFVLNMNIENDRLNYSKVKLLYTANKMKSYETEIDLNDVEYTKYIIDDNIKLIVKNNSNNQIYFGNVACLYYKQNKLVFAVNSKILNLDPGQNREITFYSRKLHLNDDYKNIKKIEYDDYKIVLYSAYDSDSSNY